MVMPMVLRKHFFFWLFVSLQLSVPAQISHPPFRYVSSDSVITYPSGRYKAKSFLHKLLMGKNYRDVWQQPVKLPVFRLSESGFTIEELGGGMQTRSLKLKDKKGQRWSLRTIDKDVQGAFKGFLKNTFVKDVAQDQISAAMPYAPLVIAPLLNRTNVIAADPIIYFVADDPALGAYRSIFAQTVCMLEERDPSFDDTDNTKKILRKLQSSNQYIVDQQVLLKARVFDMLIADWDRHYDNWRWGIKDSAGLKVYQAIPRDRDWAFYYSRGLVPKFARLAALRFLVNFDEDPDHVKSLSLKAWNFDGAFLNQMSRQDWKAAVGELQQALTDSIIEKAVKNLPPEIYALEGPEMIKKLTQRRNRMEKEVLEYYRFLARKVQIDGSNDVDVFSFLPAGRDLVLQIFRYTDKSQKTKQKIYERRFSEEETDYITINGLGSDDLFEIDETLSSSIRLTLNGGTGTDSYQLRGKLPTEVNEYAAEKSAVNNKNGAKISFH